MDQYIVVPIVCILILTGIAGWFIAKIVKSDRAHRIAFIGGLKKGKFAVIFTVTIPFFYLVYRYAGNNPFESLLCSLQDAFGFVVFKISFEISDIMVSSINPIFTAAYYYSVILCTINAFMLYFSILHRFIWKWLKKRSFYGGVAPRAVIFGYNPYNRSIYDSCDDKKIIIDALSDKEQFSLFADDVAYRSLSSRDKIKDCFVEEVKKLLDKSIKDKTRLSLIFNYTENRDELAVLEQLAQIKVAGDLNELGRLGNRLDERQNLLLCERLTELLDGYNERDLKNFDVYVFGDREHRDIYYKYEKRARGCLHYVNEYRQTAFDFLAEYPLADFLPAGAIDTEKALLKPDFDVNVIMIGFGRVNQQLFLSMLAAHQFMTEDENKNLIFKPVNYYLYDKRHTSGHKNLNHNYFRYVHNFFCPDAEPFDKDDYLPLAPKPANEHYEYLDINDVEFYDRLKKNVSQNGRGCNFFVVALGDDYTNIDFANKIGVKIKEWGLGNCNVFARIEDKTTFESAKYFFDDGNCHAFGEKKSVVYNFKKIVAEEYTKIAYLADCGYNTARNAKLGKTEGASYEELYKAWYVKPAAVKRWSNVYAALSITSKLSMMGLKMKRGSVNDSDAISREEYYAVYGSCDEAVRSAVRFNDKGECYLEYKPSKQHNLAVAEHYRWNAFMITQGFIPATKTQIRDEKDENGNYTDGKNYALRRHGNLTDYEGLTLFATEVAERNATLLFGDKKPEKEQAERLVRQADVIQYDFRLMDIAWDVLKESGFKICKKNKGE